MDPTMSATTTAFPHLQIPQEIRNVSEFLADLRRQITMRDVRSGLWYTKLLRSYLAFYEKHRSLIDADNLSPVDRDELVTKRTHRAAFRTTVAGAAAASGVTLASIVTAQSGLVAGPIVLPLAGVGMVSEMLLRSIWHLQLVCELAELYGMPVNAGRETEIIRLYALAVHAEMHQTEDDPGRGLVERVMRLQQAGGLGKLIASNLVGEMFMRNAVPFADVVLSSFRNWQLTERVGKFVKGYASRRVTLDKAVEAVDRKSQNSDAVDLVVEGIWFIFITDGRLTGVETALLAHMMRGLETSDDLTTYFVSDEAGWLERLGRLGGDRELCELVLHALHVAAKLEGQMLPQKFAILRRAAHTLGLDPPPEPVRKTEPAAPQDA
jgi:hypothetical protein